MSLPPSTTLATAWLATALLALPWAYRIPWDTPRAVPLVLLAPALWLGREKVTEAFAILARAGRPWRIIAGLMVAAVIASTALSSHWAASLVTAATWWLLAVTALLSWRLAAASPKSSEFLLGALASSSAIAVLAHWIRWWLGANPEAAFYVHHRFMGLHGVSGAIAAVGLVLLAWPRSTKRRIAWCLIGAVAWGGLLWSGSRSPLVGIAAGLFVWLLKAEWPQRVRLTVVTAGLCAGGLAVSALAWTEKPHLGWWHLWKRTAAVQSASELTSHRSDFWADSLGHVGAAPWFGHGPDAYGFLTPQLEGAQPHNLALQLALDIGVPGAAAALLILGACLGIAWARMRADHVATSTWLALGAAFVTAAFFDGYFYYTLAAFPAMVALGAGQPARGAPHAASMPAAAPRAWGAWLSITAAASAVLFLHLMLYHRTMHAGIPASASSWTARLWRSFPSTTYNVDDWIDRWARTSPDEALAAARHALPHSQTPELFRVKVAMLLARRGDHRGAIAELERARYEARPEQHAAIDVLLQRARQAAR